MPGSFIGIIHANIPEFMKKAEGRRQKGGIEGGASKGEYLLL